MALTTTIAIQLPWAGQVCNLSLQLVPLVRTSVELVSCGPHGATPPLLYCVSAPQAQEVAQLAVNAQEASSKASQHLEATRAELKAARAVAQKAAAGVGRGLYIDWGFSGRRVRWRRGQPQRWVDFSFETCSLDGR